MQYIHQRVSLIVLSALQTDDRQAGYQDNFSTAELISICYRHSNTISCIAGQDQRSAVAIFLTCMSVRVCMPKLFKNLCLSLVSRVPPLLFRTTLLVTGIPARSSPTAGQLSINISTLICRIGNNEKTQANRFSTLTSSFLIVICRPT